jgi:hypothetical protein
MNLRALKVLVTVMGITLIAGIAVLVATIAARLSHRAPALPTAFTAPPASLPKGAKIETIGAGPDRIILDLLLSDGTRQLMILDAQTGRLIGTIPLRQE